MKRAILYARTSSDDTERDSLTAQLERCRKYANEKGYKIIAELPEDVRGISGKEFYTPRIIEYLRMAENGMFDVLIAQDAKRFSRDFEKSIVLKWMLEQHSITVEYALKSYDKSTFGRIQENFDHAISAEEAETIALRLRLGRERKLEKGSFMVRNPPLGYCVVRNIDKVQVAVIVEDEAKIIQDIFSWFVYEKLSQYKIAERLNELNVPTAKNQGEWRRTTISSILRNRVYIGEFYYGRIRWEKSTVIQPDGTVKIKRKGIKRELDDCQLIEIEPIIPVELFEQAQMLLKGNKHNKRGRTANYEYLLNKRVRCHHCNSTATSVNKLNGQYLYYSCSKWRSHENHELCIKNIRSDKVDDKVFNWLQSVLTDKEKMRALMEPLWTDQKRKTDFKKMEAKAVDELLDRNTKQFNKLIEVYTTSDELTQELLEEKKAFLVEEIKNLKERKRRLSIVTEDDLLYRTPADEYNSFDDYYDAEIWMRDLHDEDLEVFGKNPSFQDKQDLIKSFDVKAEIIKNEDGTIDIKVSSNFSHTVTLPLVEKDEIIYNFGQFQPRYYFVISDLIRLE